MLVYSPGFYSEFHPMNSLRLVNYPAQIELALAKVGCVLEYVVGVTICQKANGLLHMTIFQPSI